MYTARKEDTYVYAEDILDFSLSTLEGEKVHLKDYRGKKIVHLVFWSTWCPKCLMDMTKLKKIWATRGTRSYEIVAVNVGLNESQERIRKIQQQYQMPFTVVLDNKGAVTKDFGVISIPCNIIVDKEGVVRYRFNELPEDPEELFKKVFAVKKK
jgi:peroxiredoxin